MMANGVLLKISAEDFLALTLGRACLSETGQPGGQPGSESGLKGTESEDVDHGGADPLADLPLLPDDRRFIRDKTQYLAPILRTNVLVWYRRIFLKGMQAEKKPICRENVGRRRANAFLRRYLRRLISQT